MREYSFLLSHGFCTPNVKARSLRQAWSKTKRWYKRLIILKEIGGDLRTCYMISDKDNVIMSDWKFTYDKKIKEIK